ncbi:MAG: hypothetical protein L6R30_10030 [Thermoanaerobaculia bacterium]|nr:hypothetical protein [Thermoanaerobaculia bacterium]
MKRGDEIVEDLLRRLFRLRVPESGTGLFPPLDVESSLAGDSLRVPPVQLPETAFLTSGSAVAFAAAALGLEQRTGSSLALNLDGCPSARMHFEVEGEPWSLGSRGWKATSPHRIITGKTPFSDDLSLPVRKLTLGEDESGAAAEAARALAQACNALVARQAPALAEELELVAFRMMLELLKNVEEHAYRSGPHNAIFGASLLRTRPLLHGNLLPPGIAKWLQRLDSPGTLLEVTLCDVGTGIPASLNAAYRAVHPLSEASSARLVRLSDRESAIVTAELHSAICRWALHHRSTRKRIREFTAKQLSWRGLHHVLHACWRLHGRLELRSAAGHVTVSMDPGNVEIDTGHGAPLAAFPGTQISLMIPLDHHRSPWRDPSPPKREFSYLKLAGLEKARDIHTWTRIAESFQAGPRCVGVVHEFESDERAFIETWTALWRDMPPTVIPVHLCLGVPNECFEYLTPIDVEDPAHAEGPPRLVGRVNRRGVIDWWFLGEIPRSCLAQAGDLLRTGLCHAPARSPAFDFFQHISVAYPGWIRLTADGFVFEGAGARISPDVLRSAVASAFEALRARPDSSEWMTDRPDTLVRLSTGRLVRRYISVYRLLEHSPSLAEHLAVLLRQEIESLEMQGGRASLIAESPAAYWILQRLLGSRDPDLGARIQRLGQRSTGAQILVADAMNRGESIRIRLHELEGCVAVIVLVGIGTDLATEVDGAPVRSLLQAPFEPGVETGHGQLSEMGTAQILESDYVTHIPLPPASDASLRLGTDEEREEFWQANPQSILPGFRRTGRGFLPVSASIDWLVSEARPSLIQWILREVRAMSDRGPRKRPRDVVIFTREEARVRDLVQDIAAELRASRGRFEGDVFSRPIPVVHMAERELFARPGAGLARRAPEPLGFVLESSERPSRGFHAVFLDDRCITGRTLRDFLLRVHHAGLEEGVTALTFIPIESRFSPSEEELLSSLLTNLPLAAGGSHRPESIPFRFRPLFRVPVRSVQNVTDLALLRRVNQLFESASVGDEDARRYVHGLKERIHSAHSLARPSLCKPFSPPDGDQEAQGGIHAARIRVLLSHQGQNRGALSSLLRAIELACGEQAPEVLSVFTREPDLLDLPPIRHECWPRLTKLAVEILTQTRSSLDAAEAVAFLWLQGSEVARHLPEILRAMELHGSTRGLVLAVIADCRRHGLLDDTALNGLDRPNTISVETLRRLQLVVASIDAAKAEPPLDDESAKRTFLACLNEIAYHGGAYASLHKLTEWAKKDPSAREATPSREMTASIDGAVIAVERALVPGLAALDFLLRSRSNSGAARAVRNDLKEVRSSIPRFRDTAFELAKTARVGSHANRLREDCIRFQGHLCRTTAERFLVLPPEELLRALDARDRASLPPIERWTEEIGCCPVSLLATRFAGWRRKTNVAEGALIFVYCSRAIVDHVLDLIRTDSNKHGAPGTGLIDISHAPERSGLEILVLNGPKPEDSHGFGRSQAEARRLATENGFGVEFGWLPDGLYSSRLVFHDAVDITQLKGVS